MVSNSKKELIHQPSIRGVPGPRLPFPQMHDTPTPAVTCAGSSVTKHRWGVGMGGRQIGCKAALEPGSPLDILEISQSSLNKLSLCFRTGGYQNAFFQVLIPALF